jgi:hypothetical protein
MKLQEVIENAYHVFGVYSISTPLDVCRTCCVTQDEEQALVTTPLRKISKELLSIYQNAAKPLRPNLTEFKYFLPRYLELISYFEIPSTYEPYVLSTLACYQEEEDWSEQEKAILKDFVITFFTNYIAQYPCPIRIEAIVEMFCIGG